MNALIERELRRSMTRQNIRTLPLYPEHRKCRFPTTTRILDLFANQCRHVLIDDGKLVKRFYDDLSSIQKTVLKLLGVSDAYYHTG